MHARRPLYAVPVFIPKILFHYVGQILRYVSTKSSTIFPKIVLTNIQEEKHMDFEKQMRIFSENMAMLRRNRRYSYQKFSEKLCIGKSTLQAIESGNYNIRLNTLIAIANSLQIHPALLLTELPLDLEQLNPRLYDVNLLIGYSSLPEKKRADFRELIQRLEEHPSGFFPGQNDGGVK